MRKLSIIISALIISFTGYAANIEASASTSSFMKHFTWGVDAGSSIDISGNDLSSIDMEAFFGYKNNVIKALGVGVGLHSALGNSHTLIPAYLLLRANFASRPTLCFVETRIGYSFNSLNTETEQNGIYCSAGLGFNLYISEKVKSHIVIAYTFSGLNADNSASYIKYEHSLSAMSIKIGVNF